MPKCRCLQGFLVHLAQREPRLLLPVVFNSTSLNLYVTARRPKKVAKVKGRTWRSASQGWSSQLKAGNQDSSTRMNSSSRYSLMKLDTARVMSSSVCTELLLMAAKGATSISVRMLRTLPLICAFTACPGRKHT